MPENQAVLNITIYNSKPVELLDLTESMNGLGRQYIRFLEKNGNKVTDDAKLYVREMRTGSIIIELVDLVPLTAPMFVDAENFNHVIDFAKNLKTVYEYFVGKGEAPQEELKEQDLRNYSTFLNPIARDKASQINVSGDYNYSPIVHINLNSIESNAIQNQISEAIGKIKETVPGLHNNVVFYWHTIRNSKISTSGETGIIETVSPKPIKVVFSSEYIKLQLAFIEDKNPMLSGFIVDVNVETIQGRPVLYNILKVHGIV